MQLNFASDNIMGASRPVLDALVRANDGPMASYGADEVTRRIETRLAGLFERECHVILVGTGTAANALALAACVQPWGMCVTHEESHVADDESGAPEFFTHGAKMYGLPGVGCRIDPATIASRVDDLPDRMSQMPAQAVSISQATECGLVYRPDEVAAIGEVARARGLALHMDGARFANALVSLGCTPAEMTWRAGVDILSFGATKNGCLAAEAVIAFDPRLAETLSRRRKRGGHTFSKGRLVAAQLEGYLDEDLWLANARRANAMAARLSAGLAAIPGVRLAWPTQANEVFPILPGPVDAALRAAGAVYHPWSQRALPPGERVGADEVLARMVCSFATEAQAVDDMVGAARATLVSRPSSHALA